MDTTILEQIDLLEKKLVQTDPLDENYSKILGIIGRLALLLQELRDIGEKKTNDFVEMKQVPVSPVEEVEEEPQTTTYTYDQVRTICSEAMSRGVKVKDIIKKYSAEGKLTAVAEKDYDAIVAEVQNA